MQTYFLNNKSKNLILFFNGWGMDEKPFLILNCSFDIIFISNYTNLNDNFLAKYDFSKYENISLIAFSAGVLMYAYLKDKLPKIDYKVAVNGVCKLFDEDFGINRSTLNEMKNITLENALEFRKKLISDKSQLDLFNKNQPMRDLKSSLVELAALEKYNQLIQIIDFDKIFISKDDKIIPIQNQLKFWNEFENINLIEGGHFPFYNFEALEKLL